MTPPPFTFAQYEPRGLEIIDVTLREGQQSPLLHDQYKYFLNSQDKREIVRALILYGVKFIEKQNARLGSCVVEESAKARVRFA